MAETEVHSADYPSLQAMVTEFLAQVNISVDVASFDVARSVIKIVEAALDPYHPSELCLAMVDLLVSILASEPGNLALKVLATGGVYLAGGVALHVVKFLQKPQFVRTFTRKGRFQDLMERMPIHIITTRAALVGAATFGLQSLGNIKDREEVKSSLAIV